MKIKEKGPKTKAKTHRLNCLSHQYAILYGIIQSFRHDFAYKCKFYGVTKVCKMHEISDEIKAIPSRVIIHLESKYLGKKPSQFKYKKTDVC